MKKMALVVVVALLAACGKKGSEAPKGDCATSVDKAVGLSAEDYKKANITPEMIAKIKEVSIVRCQEDKWSNDILKCLVDAKASADVATCQQKMTKEQNDNMAKAITSVTATMSPDPPDTGSGSGPGPGSGSAEAGGSAGSAEAAAGGMPKECADYKALIEKLATCDKLPQDARDTMKKSFDAAEKAWATFDKLPDDSKKAITEGCTKQAEAVRKTAAACNL